MKGWIEPVAVARWDDLAALGCREWLWLDTDAPGVHLVATLPPEPAQVTHLWGWADDRAVRVRVDVDLPHATGETGLAGAVLRWGAARPADAAELDVVTEQHRVWPARGGRAALRAVDGLHETDGSGVTLRSLTCQAAETVGQRTTLQTVSFLRR